MPYDRWLITGTLISKHFKRKR